MGLFLLHGHDLELDITRQYTSNVCSTVAAVLGRAHEMGKTNMPSHNKDLDQSDFS